MTEPEQETLAPVGESELDILAAIRDLLTEISAKLPESTEPRAF